MPSNAKMKFILLNFALIFLFDLSFSQKSPSHFKSEIDFGNGSLFSTFLDVTRTRGRFSITSPKNADVRIMPTGKAKLGRLLGKLPKKGMIITIKGAQKKDSLFGETRIPVFGKLTFKGLVKDSMLSGELFNKDAVSIGTLHGVNSTEDKINYQELYPKLIKTIQDNIYSPAAVQTREWATFEKRIEKLCMEAHDDIELFFGFNMIAQKLPFTHLNLIIAKDFGGTNDVADTSETASTQKSVVFEEKNSTTGYLLIKDFSRSQQELAAVLPGIVANRAYKNLIIDLRDNGGGGINAAFELAKYIVTEDTEVGYFPTNKLKYSGYQPELFSTLPELQPKSTNDFGKELKTSPGVKLIFKKPNNPVFTGHLYILTNSNTGSTCEPIVYALKNRKKATIIGEKTYGGMLAASPFVVSGKYVLLLPIADFYTYDGVRLDKAGVKPDIEVRSKDAEKKALEIINGGMR
jgi:hypothetical protein